MKILLIADIDDVHWNHGTGETDSVDLILSLGDNSDKLILEASQAYNCPNVFAVRGNHDHDEGKPFPKPIIDLHMTTQKFNGMTFGGLNGALRISRHPVKVPFYYEQAEVCRYMSAFPAVDIFISHNSPRGIHERNDDHYAGFDGLTNYILEHKPKYLFHGHQHINRETTCDATKVICVYGWKVMEL